jgi:hypothetical protein
MRLAPYRKIALSVGLVLLALGLVAVISASSGGTPRPALLESGSRAPAASAAVPGTGVALPPIAMPGQGAVLKTGANPGPISWLIFAAVAAVLVGIAFASTMVGRLLVRREPAREQSTEWPPSHYRAEDWEDEPRRSA